MKQSYMKLLSMIILLTSISLNTLFAQESEPNDNIANADPISLNTTVNGDINLGGNGDLVDVFLVVIPNDATVNATFSPSGSLNAYIQLYSKTGTQLGQEYVTATNQGTASEQCFAADTIYVRVQRYQGEGTYSFEVTLTDQSVYANDSEPNNVLAESIIFLTEGQTTTGHIGYYDYDSGWDDYDWYGIVLPEDGYYSFTTIHDVTAEHYVQMYYKNGTQVQSEFSYTDTTITSVGCLAQDTVYVRIDRYLGCGGYILSFNNNFTDGFANDTESSNTLAETMLFLTEGETVEGHIGYYDIVNGYDEYDWYGVILPEDGTYAFTSIRDTSGTEHYVQMYYSNGVQAGSEFTYTDTATVAVSCLAEDTVYVRIDRYTGCGGYELSFDLIKPGLFPNDLGDNDTQAGASVFLNYGETTTGHIGYYDATNSYDEYDWFGVILPEDGEYSFTTIADPEAKHYVQMYYANGVQAGSAYSTNDTTTLVINCLEADTVYIRIDRYQNCGGYMLSFDVTSLTYSNDIGDNGSIANATPIENGDVTEGHMGYYNSTTSYDEFDFYEFTVNEVPFELDADGHFAESLFGYVRLYNDVGTQIQNDYIAGGTFNVTRSITEAGTYYIAVDRYQGCGSYSLGDLCSEYPDTPTISADGPLAFCNGEDVNLTSTVEATYEWSTGATTQSINVTTSGDYSVTVKDLNGCPAESGPTTVTVWPLPAVPTITADGPTTFCAGDDVTLTSTPEASYLWSTGETTQSITVSTTGSYSVTVTDSNGCSRTSAVTAVVRNPNPGIPTITPDGPTTFCDGGSVTLTSSSAAGYLWSTGETTQSITVSTSGSFTVMVNNNFGCTRTSSATSVTVNPLPPVPSISADGPTEFCDGEDVILTSDASDSYLWSTGATTQSIVVSISGNYSVTVTDSNGCSRTSSVTSVTVNALPATPAITPDGPTTFCETESVTLTSSAEDSYLWSTGATTQSILVTTSGSYSVTVTTADGCSATSSTTSVTVNPNSTWYADTDGDGYGDSGSTLEYCTQPAGYVSNDLDCDDSDEFINPDSDEVCYNAEDDNCDGSIDEGCPDCSVFDTAPVDLTKSFDPVNGVQDRVQVKWFKDTPQVRYSDADAAACDIKFWAKRNLDPVTGNPVGPAITDPDTVNILNTKKFQPDGITPREIFKWPVKFRADGANNNKRAEPNIRYEWQVRCACDHGAGPESPWSAVKIFNTPDFDPSTGIYTLPSSPSSGEVKWIGEQNMDIKLYPNPNDGDAINLDLSADIDEVFTVQIVDMTSKVLHLEQINSAKRGVMRINFYNGGLPAGMYTINLIQTDKMYRSRFVVR